MSDLASQIARHEKLWRNAAKAPALTLAYPMSNWAFNNFPFGKQKIALAAINYHKGAADALMRIARGLEDDLKKAREYRDAAVRENRRMRDEQIAWGHREGKYLEAIEIRDNQHEAATKLIDDLAGELARLKKDRDA